MRKTILALLVGAFCTSGALAMGKVPDASVEAPRHVAAQPAQHAARPSAPVQHTAPRAAPVAACEPTVVYLPAPKPVVVAKPSFIERLDLDWWKLGSVAAVLLAFFILLSAARRIYVASKGTPVVQ